MGSKYLGIFLILFSQSAFATLGKLESTIIKSKTLVKSVQKTANQSAYHVQITESDGLVVREYVAPDGLVFGVAWNGQGEPDFESLLGDYNAQYQTLAREAPKVLGKRNSQVKSSSLMVARWGHMRNLQGKAYDPNLLPSGVTADDIK